MVSKRYFFIKAKCISIVTTIVSGIDVTGIVPVKMKVKIKN